MALSNYLHSVLAGLASQLEWSVESGSYDFIVEEVLEKCDATNESDVPVNKLHAVGKLCLWEKLLTEISFDYDFSAESVSQKRSQLFDHIKTKYDESYLSAMSYLPGYSIETGELIINDPYEYRG